MVLNAAIPSTGAGAAYSPQPITLPFATGYPKEGPLSALVFLTIPTGQLSGSLNVNISQFGMSMVQSLLVDNEANIVPITINVGQSNASVAFGIQPNGTQIIPVFQTGVNLTINVTVGPGAVAPVALAFQIFNTYVPPSSWVSNLSVNGDVDIMNVSGGVNVQVTNATSLGVGIVAEPVGGANSAFIGVNSAIKTLKANPGTFKGLCCSALVVGWLQMFDVSNATNITLGTTPPTFTFPFTIVNVVSPLNLPPEGLKFVNGLYMSFTTTPNGSTDTGSYLVGTAYYA